MATKTTPTPARAPHVAVVTVARGRREHLARQQRWMRRHAAGIEHVVVDMGGDPIGGSGTVVDMSVADGEPLPLAAARNLGARSTAAEVIVFLDVDCLPTSPLVPSYLCQVERQGGLWAGPVGYLPPAVEISDWSVDALMRCAHFHPGRPQPHRPAQAAESFDSFWSLSFAIGRRDWDRIGGFDERYVGYGGEDTDFARAAEQRGLRFWFDGHAIAFHQHHPVSSPPLEHLDEIVANATLFHDTWGDWPMSGWLSAFHDAGLIDWTADCDRIGARASP